MSGLVLIVDASCLYEVVADTDRAHHIRARLPLDPDHAPPSVVDATAATQAVDDLREWPGERFAQRPLRAALHNE